MMKRFYDTNPSFQRYSTAFNRQLETVRSNVKWMKHNYARISQWFQKAAQSSWTMADPKLKSRKHGAVALDVVAERS
ncbi:unnamed protein product [Soboliphyme baturini]|uniref:Transposase n=1 Tax=Soboliphyme baturini TaxID=241478 RepID=A0A183I9L7_9BILA|nr:unnamed protein product [Soboliphyme baturini]